MHAIFVTGVTNSLFSVLNNLNDITIDPLAADLLGYSEEEIINNFGGQIGEMAKNSNVAESVILSDLKSWYYGYRFSKENLEVCNPLSIFYYFQKKKLENFWFELGIPVFLNDPLKKQFYILDNLEKVEFSAASLGTFDFENMPLITVLFQTGYLTIKDHDPITQKYMLGYPNFEVKESFDTYLLSIE